MWEEFLKALTQETEAGKAVRLMAEKLRKMEEEENENLEKTSGSSLVRSDEKA